MVSSRSQRPRQPARTDSCFWIEGLSALKEYAQHKPQAVRRIVLKEGNEKHLTRAIKNIGCAIESYETASRNEDLPLSAPVQFLAEVRASDSQTFLARKLKEAKTHDLVLVLDHISDPRNLGAIVRSCAFFGVREIIVANARQVLLTPSSVSTAQGGFAVVDLVIVTNIAQFLTRLQEANYWTICADAKGEDLPTIKSRQYEKVALVLGSEGKGVSALVRKRCDLSVGIAGGEVSIDSLNVSVAAGILLHELCLKAQPSS
jgi:23S rRNA (guanosine2251-2'-O)-methyltransferase